MKVVAMRESKDLSKITTFELFSNLNAYEFDIDQRKDEETPSSKVTTLVASTAESNQAADSEIQKFVKVGKSYLKKGSSKPTTEVKDSKASKGSNTNGYICYNCRKPGHFIKDCPYPESKKYTDDEKASRAKRKRK
ncbi:hypothetical protein ACS0TY_028847 [Phlomoides rotata]